MSLPLTVHKRLPKRLPLSLGFKRYALYFDGATSHVLVEPLEPIQNKPISEFTFIAWVKYLKDTGEAQQIFEGITRGWEIFIEGRFPDLTFLITDDDGNQHSVETSLTKGLNTWYFIAGTYDGSEQKLFVDGELVASTSWSGTFTLKTGIRLGRDYEVEFQYFCGLIGEVLVYERALTEEEIRYNMLNYHNPIRDGLILWLHDRITADTWYDESGYGNHGTIYGAVRKNLAAWELRAEVGL